MFDWLDNTVIKLCNMPPVGTDLNTVKEQLNEMKVRSRPGRKLGVLLLPGRGGFAHLYSACLAVLRIRLSALFFIYGPFISLKLLRGILSTRTAQ